MALDLFTNSYSSGGRIIRMLAKAIDVTLNQKLLNIHIGEQLQPEFIAVSSPQYSKIMIELHFFFVCIGKSSAYDTYIGR